MRNQTRIHQGGLAAAGGTVDQSDTKRLVGIGFLDPGLPEMDALGQTILPERAG